MLMQGKVYLQGEDGRRFFVGDQIKVSTEDTGSITGRIATIYQCSMFLGTKAAPYAYIVFQDITSIEEVPK